MYKLYSQRKREETKNSSDAFIYDNFSPEFRNQFFFIINDIIDDPTFYSVVYNGYCTGWEKVCMLYSREKGLKDIHDEYYNNVNNKWALEEYLEECANEDFLDFLDFSLTEIIYPLKDWDYFNEIVDSLIQELNFRFKQHSLGYEFINGKLISKMNEQTHKEIVKPALFLLHDERFAGAEQEFFQAFDCFKKAQYKDAIANANKSFESVMKTICKEQGYIYKETDTAKPLLQHLIDNAFFPNYLESHLTALRSTLECGIPTVRNKTSGHGQGQEVISVSTETVEYALNLVATNIVFLVKLLNNKQ